MKKLFAAILIALSTLAIQPRPGDCVDTYLLGYSGKGELIPAKLCRVPAKGVFVEPEIVGCKLAKSLYIAYKAFSRRHGPISGGVALKVAGPVTYVDGRSADLALYVGIYSLYMGKKPLPATGKIGEDLYRVEGVAYVKEKLSVTTRPTIIPYANRYDIVGDVPVIPVKSLDDVDAILSTLPS